MGGILNPSLIILNSFLSPLLLVELPVHPSLNAGPPTLQISSHELLVAKSLDVGVLNGHDMVHVLAKHPDLGTLKSLQTIRIVVGSAHAPEKCIYGNIKNKQYIFYFGI